MRRAVVLVALAACHGAAAIDPDAAAPESDAAAPDARPPPVDPNSLPCAAPPPLTGVAALTDGAATIDTIDDTHDRIDYQGRVGDPLLLTLAFREGLGVVTGGFAPGTYTVSGDEGGTETCGLCTMLITNYFEPSRSQYLLAQAGTITLDRIDRTADGRLIGELTGLTLQRVVYKDGAWILEDGCTTTIDQVSFDLPLTPGPFFP